MNKKELIKQMKKEINAGYILQVFAPGYKRINLWISDDRKHIMFRRFGEPAAIKNKLQELIWLINTFMDTSWQEVEIEYKHIKSTID